jgi:hypothetical protein
MGRLDGICIYDHCPCVNRVLALPKMVCPKCCFNRHQRINIPSNYNTEVRSLIGANASFNGTYPKYGIRLS